MSDIDLHNTAVSELKLTTISFIEWNERANNGQYPDVTKTHWSKALGAIDSISDANMEERDNSWKYLEATTISYPKWKNNVDSGKYVDPTKTNWWKAFDSLSKITNNGNEFKNKFPWIFDLLEKTPNKKNLIGPQSISSAKNYYIDGIKVNGGSVDGFKISSNGISELILIRNLDISNLSSSDKVQGISAHGKIIKVAFLSGKIFNIDLSHKLSHGAYIGRNNTTEVVLASILSVNTGGHNLMFYPGGISNSTMINVTAIGSKLGPGLSFREHPSEGNGPVDKIDIYNAIMCFNDRYGAELQDATNIRFIRPCIYGNKSGTISRSGNTDGFELIDPIYEDPDFDNNYKPRNTKVINGAIPEMLPPFDAYGNPFTKATIGAVAG